LLGLPNESITLTAAASASTSLSVTSTALVDWAKPGQRVVVVTRDSTTNDRVGTDAVVQSATSAGLVLDTAVTAPAGAEVMPAVPIYLEPQQSIPRYRTAVETWQLQARRAV